jgi:hypothetical protein
VLSIDWGPNLIFIYISSRLVYPSLDRRILLEKSYKLSFVEGHASTAYDIFTDYFSFEMQNEVLYFKSKKDTKKDTKSHE